MLFYIPGVGNTPTTEAANSVEQSPCHEACSSTAVNHLPTICSARYFITVFTTAPHLSRSWARWTQSTPFHYVSLISILILYNLRQVLLVVCFLQVFSTTKLVHFCSASRCPMPRLSNCPSFDHPNNIWRAMQIMKLLIVNFFCRPLCPSLFNLNIFLSFVFWAALSLLPPLCETKLHVKERTD